MQKAPFCTLHRKRDTVLPLEHFRRLSDSTMIFQRFVTLSHFFVLFRAAASGSKIYNGQRLFSDARIISFIDPAKHGFHVILDEDFVKSHLQPVHLPTVYVSAIGLKPFNSLNAIGQRRGNDTSASSFSRDGSLRVTKILYPENGNPDDGLLDGRTIKLLGLQERTWYYVCVEFESNVNRHEIATGTSCRLARTLDKFGKTVESTVSEIELIEISDDSIRVQVTVDTDFPLRLHTYMSSGDDGDPRPTSTNSAVSAPAAQTFIVKKSQTLNVVFGPFLQPETSYGRFCVFEEPLSEAYTAMGRSARVTFEHCYFDDLKTKPREGDSMQKIYESGMFLMSEQPRSRLAEEREVAKLVSSAHGLKGNMYFLTVFLLLCIFCRSVASRL